MSCCVDLGPEGTNGAIDGPLFFILYLINNDYGLNVVIQKTWRIVDSGGKQGGG